MLRDMVSEVEGHGQMAYPAAIYILQTPASFTFNSLDEWPSGRDASSNAEWQSLG